MFDPSPRSPAPASSLEPERRPARTPLRTFLLRQQLRWLALVSPRRAAHRGLMLFCTPNAHGRRRARAGAPDADAAVAMLDVDGHTLATYVWGDPRTQPHVLLAHAWGSHGLRYRRWVEALRDVGYAVVAFDQRAHGRSSGRTATLGELARDLTAVGHRYGRAAAVVGHGLGGAAAAVALGAGLAADCAVLLAPEADPHDAFHRFARPLRLSARTRRAAIALLEQRNGASLDALQAHRTARLLATPALVVHDLQDAQVPWSEGERYARHWPGARLLTTTGLGHHALARDAVVVAAALRFLRGEDIGERVVSSPNLPYGVA